MPELGQQVGEYIIEAEIGGGGMAKVYRARHSILETHHALKVLDPKYRVNPEARKRFLDEAKIQAKHLNHPNIVKVTNIVATADAAALVMELIEGGNLESMIEKQKKALPAGKFLELALPILDAIGHAHEAGIIHRDIKPANVLLARDGDRLVPKLTDFGIAKVGDKISSKKKSTHVDARMGTLAYMSPEQIRRAKSVTARSDIFSIGAMFYEMATGCIPFDGDSEFDIMEKIVHGRFVEPEKLASPDVAPHILSAIKRALSPEPGERFASCADFAAALRGERTPSAAVSLAGAGPARSGGRRWGVFALLFAAAAAAAGAAIYLSRSSGSEHKTVVARDAGPVHGDTESGQAGTQSYVSELPPEADAAPPPPPDAAAPPPDAAPPPEPKKSRCLGRWSSKDFDLRITSERSSCGSVTFISGPMRCHSSLTGCSVSHTHVRGSYSCRYNRKGPPPLRGNVSMGCSGRSSSVDVLVNGSRKKKYVRKR